MIVTRRTMVSLEVDTPDFNMLLDTLDEASKVRSRLYPQMNKRARRLYDSIAKAAGMQMGVLDATHE